MGVAEDVAVVVAAVAAVVVVVVCPTPPRVAQVAAGMKEARAAEGAAEEWVAARRGLP